MVLEAITSHTYNSSLSCTHEEGLPENLHCQDRMPNTVLFQTLEGMAMNRGIRCYSDDLEGKLAALEHLEKEHKPWQQSSFQELLTFPLCSEMDESAFVVSSDISNQQRVQHNANTTTGCVCNSQNHLTQSQIQLLEPESCITHVSESCSPVKTETKPDHSSSDAVEEGVSSATREPNSYTTVNSLENCAGGASEPRTSTDVDPTSQLSTRTDVVRERRKRKRSKACKNIEEVESQRMTHIAVERNRRKQMNDHLTVLRSLMPGSYIQRFCRFSARIRDRFYDSRSSLMQGDQASIIGGAIDFVKELEQLLQSLQAQKRRRECEEGYSPISPIPFNGFFLSPQYTSYSAQWNSKYIVDDLSYDPANDLIAENKSAIADIEVTVIETHASLKVLSRKRPGQLLKTIAALQGLHLTILHLNITTIDQTVLYSFNVKIEDECQLTSADEIATAVHRIFNIIHSNAIN